MEEGLGGRVSTCSCCQESTMEGRRRKGRNGRSVAAIGQTQLEVQSQGAQMVETAAQLTLSGSEERGEWNLRKREIESNHHIEKHLF